MSVQTSKSMLKVFGVLDVIFGVLLVIFSALAFTGGGLMASAA